MSLSNEVHVMNKGVCGVRIEVCLSQTAVCKEGVEWVSVSDSCM
jgi:hypothetical protein